MWTHRFAIVTAVLTWFLLLLSGIAHRTDSSLACLDWPLCSSPLFTAAAGGGVPVEQGRRLLPPWSVSSRSSRAGSPGRWAPLAWRGACTGGPGVWLGDASGRGGRWSCLRSIADPFVLGPALHPDAVFATLIAIAGLTRHAVLGQALHRRDEVPRFSHGLLLLTTGLAFLQMVLGGIVRHSGGGSLASTSRFAAAVCCLWGAPGRGHACCPPPQWAGVRAVPIRHGASASQSAPTRVRCVSSSLADGATPSDPAADRSGHPRRVGAISGFSMSPAHLGIGALILGGLVLLCLRLRPAREYGRGRPVG